MSEPNNQLNRQEAGLLTDKQFFMPISKTKHSSPDH